MADCRKRTSNPLTHRDPIVTGPGEEAHVDDSSRRPADHLHWSVWTDAEDKWKAIDLTRATRPESRCWPFEVVLNITIQKMRIKVALLTIFSVESNRIPVEQ
jgi:hypothetical protein